jgi:hypothetical protein
VPFIILNVIITGVVVICIVAIIGTSDVKTQQDAAYAGSGITAILAVLLSVTSIFYGIKLTRQLTQGTTKATQMKGALLFRNAGVVFCLCFGAQAVLSILAITQINEAGDRDSANTSLALFYIFDVIGLFVLLGLFMSGVQKLKKQPSGYTRTNTGPTSKSDKNSSKADKSSGRNTTVVSKTDTGSKSEPVSDDAVFKAEPMSKSDKKEESVGLSSTTAMTSSSTAPIELKQLEVAVVKMENGAKAT